MMQPFQQRPHAIRLEWGPVAIAQLGPLVDAVVVVDLLSFSTCVSLAVERGATLYPYPWRDDSAQAFARERGAELAGQRGSAGWSLSPRSMLSAGPDLRLVLPSPNGAACVHLAASLGKAVYCASLRNLAATAAACRHHARVLVVPCGERWPDGSLRPALEDLVTAGGLVAAWGPANGSPEAQAAALLHDSLGPQRTQALRACASAQELITRGFADGR